MARSHAFTQQGKLFLTIAAVLLLGAVLVLYSQKAGGLGANALVTQVEESEQKNRRDYLRDRLRNAVDLRKEITQIKKDAKNVTVDASVAEGHLAEFEKCLAKLDTFVPTDDFWNENRDCDDHSTFVQDELQDRLRPIRDCANNKKNIESRKKERNELGRQVTNILRNDKEADVSSLTAILSQIDVQLTAGDQVQVAACTRDNADVLNDAQKELNSLFQDFYSTSGDINTAADQKRQAVEGRKDLDKNIKRNCERDKKREFTNYQKDFDRAAKKGAVTPEQQTEFDAVKALYEKVCVELVGSMQTALDANDTDAFNDARSEYWNSDRDFWDSLNNARGTVQEKQREVEETKRKEMDLKNVMRDLTGKESEVRRMKKQLSRMKKRYERAVKKYAERADRQELIVAFKTVLNESEGLLTNIETLVANAKAAAPEDPEAYWMDYQQELNDLQNTFNEQQGRTDMIAEMFQHLIDAEKMLKGGERDIERFDENPELQEELRSLLRKGRDALQQAWSNLVNDPEVAKEALEGIRDLGEDWDETIRDFTDETAEEEE